MKPVIYKEQQLQYTINEQGQVFSLYSNRYLKGNINNGGYVMIQLSGVKDKKNGRVQVPLHRIVAEAFLSNPKNLPVVNHKDGDKLNNCVENLEWTSYSENTQHAHNTNLFESPKTKREKTVLSQEELIKNWRQYLDTNYWISAEGRVYNKKTNILLKETYSKKASDYIRYSLRIDGKTVNKLGHVLVMTAWNRAPLDSELINHKDGNKFNNNINNLEFVSKTENSVHACYTLGKIVQSVVRIDREGNKTFYPSITVAAQENNLSVSAVSTAIKNNSWSCHRQYRWEKIQK